MTSPLLALRAGLIARLSGDAGLATLMSGRLRLYDEPPRGAEPVYALFGPAEARDDSVQGARRHLHMLSLIVFGRTGSARSCLDVAERMAARLDDAPLTLDGHGLVLLRVEAVVASRDESSGETRATLTLRAVTEVTSLP